MKGDDYIAFREGEVWGFRDGSGRTVIPPRYQSAGSFSEALARVRIDRKWAYIDPTGTVVIPALYDQAGAFTGGKAKVKLEDQWVLIDRSGTVVETVTAHSFLDDRGGFVSEQEHRDWEKPIRRKDQD